jgi:hypothetical protein
MGGKREEVVTYLNISHPNLDSMNLSTSEFLIPIWRPSCHPSISYIFNRSFNYKVQYRNPTQTIVNCITTLCFPGLRRLSALDSSKDEITKGA